MHTYTLLLACFFGGLIVGFFYPKGLTKQPVCLKCNIVIISIDPLRGDHLPCTGYIFNTAPNICKFASQGSIFTRAYAQSSWTMPSIISMITSTYPYEHGMLIPHQSVLPPHIDTLPQVLKNNSYHTIYSGDLNNSHLPLDMGLGRGFDTLTTYTRETNDIISLLEEGKKKNKPTFLFLHNFDMLASWRSAGDPPQPFFFDPSFVPPSISMTSFLPQTWNESIHYLEQQLSLSADETRILSLLKKSTSIDQAYIYFKQLSKNDQELITSFSIFSAIDTHNPSHRRLLQNLYDERLLRVDESLGTMLDTLSKPPWRDTTIVILVSNHGDEFGEHGSINHGTNLFGSTTHIPLIIRIPSMKPTRNDGIVSSIDLYPTILDAIGIPIPTSVRGESILSNRVGTKTKKDYAISQLGPLPWLSSIRTNDWSYYSAASDGDKPKLFDLTTDPNEQHNVMLNHPITAGTLARQLDLVNRSHIYDTSIHLPAP